MYIESTWLANISIYHKVALFLYPPAKNMGDFDIDAVKHFCIDQISENTQLYTLEETASASTVSHVTSTLLTSPSIETSSSSMLLSNNIQISSTPQSDLHFFFQIFQTWARRKVSEKKQIDIIMNEYKLIVTSTQFNGGISITLSFHACQNLHSKYYLYLQVVRRLNVYFPWPVI